MNDETNHDDVLDLTDLAPERMQIRLDHDGPIYTLASPDEFGIREKARLAELQEKVARLQNGKMRSQDIDRITDIFEKVTKLVLRDCSDEDFKSLSESDQEKIAMVFTGSWVDYQQKLIEQAGGEKALALAELLSSELT